MEEENNRTYEIIMNFIDIYKKKLSEEELKFLLRYARSLKKRNYENQNNITEIDILEDIKKLNEVIKEGELTSLSFNRLKREIELYEQLINGENIHDISYELDKLYIESDMGARKNSSLAYQLIDRFDIEKKGNQK